MRRLQLLIALLLILHCAIARASVPITLSVSLSTDRPDPGSDLMTTVVVFGGAGDVDVAVELPNGVTGPAATAIHAAPVGLAVVRLHVASDAVVGPRVLRFRAGGRLISKQIYVGIFPWPPAQRPVWRLWMPLMRKP